MRAEHMRYEVPGWGVGDVWSSADGVVLAHELEFTAAAGEPLVPRPPEGAASPPTATLAGIRSRVGNGSVTNARRSGGGSGDGRRARGVDDRPRRDGLPDADDLQRGDALPRGDDVPDADGLLHADDLPNRAACPHGAARLVELAAAFLAGDDVSFDEVEIDLSWATPFQLAVADVVRSLPRGEVAAYGEIAALAGYPRAGRAVGTFCARNRFALVLPCHRVVGSDGIGSYGSAGVGVKRRLLALEGVRL